MREGQTVVVTRLIFAIPEGKGEMGNALVSVFECVGGATGIMQQWLRDGGVEDIGISKL